MRTGEASYLDGTAARRRPVQVELDGAGIAIREDGKRTAFWRYADLQQADAPSGMLRISANGAPELARLEIRDAALGAAIVERCPELRRPRRADASGAGRIVFWSLAAVISLVLTVVYLVPLVADRLAPFVPIPVERRLGEAVDNQVRAMFGTDTCDAAAGRAALAKLGTQLTGAADLPMPVDIAVLPSEIPNAFALPGGNVYVLQALLEAADGPDQLAGVLAHEFGHVAHRDGLRKLLQTGGSSFLLGLLFGDVTGGGALIFAAQTMVDSSYSRQAETAADAFSAQLMLKLGRSPKVLGTFLAKLDKSGDSKLAFLLSHPLTSERLRALEAEDRPASGPPLLSDEEWRALKGICAGREK
jgi:predicted Zn-dependent protease